MMRPSTWLMLFVAGCGGKNAADSEPPCAEVAGHMVQLAVEDNQYENEPDELEGVKETFIMQCEADAWSAARRRCLRDAPTQDAALACPGQ